MSRSMSRLLTFPFPTTSNAEPTLGVPVAGSLAGGSSPFVSPLVATMLAGAPAAPADYIRDRQPPADWIRSLREVSEKSDEVGWLYLHWEAGDPWVPGQRWVLYEMLHEKWVDDAVMDELRGPHPRSEGHMCSTKVPKQFGCLCRRKLGAWRGGPCQLVTLTQYQLYRTTGYVAKPFWIIQGTTGGHLWEFDESEREILRYANLPSEAPRLGALPYAPFDGRVLRQIMRRNRLRAMGGSIEAYKQTMGAGYDVYRQKIAREMRARYVEYLEQQLQDVNELFIRAAKKGDLDDQPRTDVNWEKVEEASTATYIEEGHQLHPSMVK
jgi:hypothetical protein